MSSMSPMNSIRSKRSVETLGRSVGGVDAPATTTHCSLYPL